MDTETLHVSQLYQSMGMVAVLIVFITEILSFKFELMGHVFSVRSREHMNEEVWMKVENEEKNLEATPDLEKSAIESLKREMSEFESRNSERIQEDKAKKEEVKENAIELLGELNPSQKSVLLFYIEYNNFLSEHISIIYSVLVLGMITNSTKIFSLAAFFCYLFSSLVFDFLHLEEKLKAQYKKGIVLRRIVKILSTSFILGIFISYWCVGEFND